MKLTIFLVASFLHSAIAATCYFHINQGEYTCRLDNANYVDPDELFAIDGLHMSGRSHENVTFMYTAWDSNLHFVPQQIFDQFSNLIRVELTNAGVQELHRPWRRCDHLRQAYFALNNITTLPGGIFEECSEIQSLELTSCGIHEVHQKAFEGLASLTLLDLQNNFIKYLQPETFVPLSSLRTLLLSNAGLEIIHPDTFQPLQAITSISIGLNQIKKIETGTFVGLPELLQVWLQHNLNLTLIEPMAFGSLNRLERIIWNNGILTQLSTSSFSNLTTTVSIDFAHQKIGKIERNFFTNFPNLRFLDFRFNSCVNRNLWSQSDRQEFLPYLEECFWRFEGTPETTLGASSMVSSSGLISLLLIIMKI